MARYRYLLFAVIATGVLAGCATAPERAVPAQHGHAISQSPLPTPAVSMRINDAGIALIKEAEGLHLHAYRDNGQWLIGYGHADGARAGMAISTTHADRLLREDIALCERKVGVALHVPVSTNAFSAMVSLCYNVGWQPVAASTLVRKLNAGDQAGAADAFLDWSKITTGGEKVTLARLAERRAKERALFLQADAS